MNKELEQLYAQYSQVNDISNGAADKLKKDKKTK